MSHLFREARDNAQDILAAVAATALRSEVNRRFVIEASRE